MSKDRFSDNSKQYAKFRPTYPPALYDFVFQFVTQRQAAWDCGTGNGQVAQVLAQHFGKVCATDISQKQLDEATQLPNIEYICCNEKQTPFQDHQFDLMVVAQAVHWFDFEAFYQEMRRVATQEAIVALWGYNLLKISPAIDKLILNFYTEKVGSFWDAERKHVENDYQTVPFPFEAIKVPTFAMDFVWDLATLEGYLNTWSSVGKFIKQHNYNPVNEAIEEIKPLWKENEQKNITFPIFMKLGRV
jgi:ubiquinone/menaquinone biosynthesis C-methylase UbiE